MGYQTITAEPPVGHHIDSVAVSQVRAVIDLILAAGAAFREIGMAGVSDNEPPGESELVAVAEAGRAWVAASGDDPVGCILVEIVDDTAHVVQVSVHPEYAGRRLGQRLIDHVEAWARESGLQALTLTTFADVPWNGPYYRRLGFEPVPEAALTSGLARAREEERAAGLDLWGRVAMRRPVGAAEVTAEGG